MTILRPFHRLLVSTLLAACLGGDGLAVVLSGYDVKAAFLFNFTRFVEWPAMEPPLERFRIGILGTDPFTPGLSEILAGKTVGGLPVEVETLRSGMDARKCQLVWISASEERELSEILSVLSGYPALTVSDIPSFIRRGGMIGFEIDEGRVRFNVNLTATDRAGMKISSDMLKLAKRVRGGIRTVTALL